MAKLKSSVSEGSSKSQNSFCLFLALIFIFLVVLVHSNDSSSNINPSIPTDQTTLIPRSSSSNMNLHGTAGGKSPTSHKSPSASPYSSSREFEAGEHEVPSGPNPISN